MKKIVLISFALVMAFSLRAQTVIFHFVMDMSSAQLGANVAACVAPFDTSVNNVELMGNYVNDWSSASGLNTACTDPITSVPLVDFVQVPGTFLYWKIDTLTDDSNSDFYDLRDGGHNVNVKGRIDHSWDNAEFAGNGNHVIVVQPGTSVMTVQWTFGDTAQADIIVTGIKNTKLVGVNSLAPNPANGRTTLEYTTTAVGKVQISIMNLVGQTVRTVLNTQQTAGLHVQQVNVAGLANGIYFININVNGSIVARKFNVMN
jgi:hypothetical protein